VAAESVRLALVQTDPSPSVSENVEEVRAAVARHPAALVVFPELALNGYDLADVARHALQPDGAELGAVAAAAREARSRVVVGFAERVDGGVANSAACFDADGTLAGVYRKTHLFGGERRTFVAGTGLQPIAVGGTALGVMVCFDVEFPEVARTLARRGAELLVTISANMDPFGDDHDLLVRSRALESHLPHVYVNRTGTQGRWAFVGRTQAVRHDGSVIARLEGEPGELAVDVELGGGFDERVDYVAQLRPELYA
jgi:predicted amidohydrolase